MKSIKYALIAIFLCGIIATGFVTVPEKKQVIFLQSAESNISPDQMNKAAEVITLRLKNFLSGPFDVKAVSGRNQIRITVDGNAELKMIKSLITQKGMFSFYKTYNNQSLKDLVKDDKNLVNMLLERGNAASSATLLCTSADSIGYFERYLAPSSVNEEVRFAWSNLFDEQDACLYALQTGKENIIPLTGADIESFETKQDAQARWQSIGFRFREPVIGVWADITKSNLGKAIAVLMDNKVLFAPVVQSEITGGNLEITGDFSQTEVRFIAAVGKSGTLPVSLVVVK
ncbi:MAG TPA: hypothetical protein PKI35_07925 [Bacteroidales bacterium]|nr:hypothetical protein [Bacteroidales bacterium]